MLLVPADGELDCLGYLVNKLAPEDLVLRLFVSNITPADTDEASDYVEASWVGYQAAQLAGENWILAAGMPSVASYSKQVFTSSGNNQDALNFGYYLTRAKSGRIAWAERFAKPWHCSNAGDWVSVTPRITQGTQKGARASARGKWVVRDGGEVGLVVAFRDGKAAEFHRVGAEGLTELELLVDPATLSQAAYLDIPEPRRPNREIAATMGYS